MKITVLAATVLFPLAVAAQQTCPALPLGASVHWRHDQGPDFDVCYALNNDGTVAFGLYRGNAPDFHPERLVPAGTGTVAGRWVTWYTAGPEGTYQTVVPLNLSTVYGMHVFIPRTPTSTFAQRVKLVGALTIESSGAP